MKKKKKKALILQMDSLDPKSPYLIQVSLSLPVHNWIHQTPNQNFNCWLLSILKLEPKEEDELIIIFFFFFIYIFAKFRKPTCCNFKNIEQK